MNKEDCLGYENIMDELEMDLEFSDIDSNHDSDIDSNIGEDLDQIINSEIDRELEDNAEEVEPEEGTAEKECEWREWLTNDEVFSKFVWSNVSGFKPPVNKSLNVPLDYFQLFFTDELLNEIVKETNRYAKEKIQKVTPLRKRSVWWSWKDVTLTEMKAFLGVLLNMAMNPKPEVEDYFSADWIDYQPFFKDVFSKVRFQQIFWNLHVSPPPQGPSVGTLTRFGKVRNVVLYLDKKYREYYLPKNKVSVDESTVGFKGRVLFKVYNKDKPIKWGIKIFVLSESCSGYICALEPYFGKSTIDRMGRPDLCTTSRIVLHLVNKMQEAYGDIEGLHIFSDRYYTNVELAKVLSDMKIHITGTIMRNRLGLPDVVRCSSKSKRRKTPAIKLKKGDIKSYRKDNRFNVLMWKDSNDVTMLSTLYDNSTQNVRRIRKQGVVEEIKKPTVVCKYNESMGGVDIADHYISSYAFTRKSLKWWRKVFFWLVETAVVNAFLLYNMNQGQGKERQRQFRKKLITGLVGSVRNLKKRERPSDVYEEERLNGKLHILDHLPKSKDCTVCSVRDGSGTRKRTKFFCKTCISEPALCVGQCFSKYHTVKKFRD